MDIDSDEDDYDESRPDLYPPADYRILEDKEKDNKKVDIHQLELERTRLYCEKKSLLEERDKLSSITSKLDTPYIVCTVVYIITTVLMFFVDDFRIFELCLFLLMIKFIENCSYKEILKDIYHTIDVIDYKEKEITKQFSEIVSKIENERKNT